jgi:hypothetical protein
VGRFVFGVMKTKILMILSLVTYSFCNAQTVYDLTDPEPDLGTYNYYMKDINNVLDPFVGTWVYTDGGNTITMTLKKKIKVKTSSRSVFQDFLYGEYRFEQNGVVVLDYMSQLDDPNITNIHEHKIEGNRLPSHSVFDHDPNVTGYVVDLSMCEPNVCSTFIMYRTTINGVDALKVFKRQMITYKLRGEPSYYTVMPDGYLTFIKQ